MFANAHSASGRQGITCAALHGAGKARREEGESKKILHKSINLLSSVSSLCSLGNFFAMIGLFGLRMCFLLTTPLFQRYVKRGKARTEISSSALASLFPTAAIRKQVSFANHVPYFVVATLSPRRATIHSGLVTCAIRTHPVPLPSGTRIHAVRSDPAKTQVKPPLHK